MRIFRKDKNGQMMVLEAILFSIMLILALIFIYQLSPPSVSTKTRYLNQLKILSDDAVRTLDQLSSTYDPINIPSLLVEYILLNDTVNASIYFRSVLPYDVGFNIYVGNTNQTVLWYEGGWGEKTDSVTRSNHIFVLSNNKLRGALSINNYLKGQIISGYTDCEYIFILETWVIL